ncbi:MAG: ACP S-malonyltransferase [Chloroflexi bacterium]|nr:ACP S-malonyltransferase [Chloroflexota bacterium]
MMPNPSGSTKVAYIFPGQGSQQVGMGKDLYESSPSARAIFDRANEILGFNLRDLCFNGPEEELTDTVNAQPAILTTSTACLEALREYCAAQGLQLAPSYVAGHSLGEYSALVAAGSLEFQEALLLVRERGRLMKEAGERHPGGMAAMLGIGDAALAEVCARASDKGVVCIANFNCPGQTVISGENQALGEAMRLALSAGAKRAIRLAVSIASHSPLMSEASVHFTPALRECRIGEARTPLIANVSGRTTVSAEEIRRELSDQLCSAVRWQQSVSEMSSQGVGVFVEIGPGQVLSGLVKRTVKDVTTCSVGDSKSLDTLRSVLEMAAASH